MAKPAPGDPITAVTCFRGLERHSILPYMGLELLLLLPHPWSWITNLAHHYRETTIALIPAALGYGSCINLLCQSQAATALSPAPRFQVIALVCHCWGHVIAVLSPASWIPVCD